MKALHKLLALVVLFMGFVSTSQGQDKIYKKTKEIIDCTIKEVGSEDIKYHTPEVPSDVLLSISIDKIYKIEFSNGKQMFFQDNFSDPENYADQNKNLIKVNFLEPLQGSTSFTYERSLRPGSSIESTLGIIGLGWDPTESQGAGAYLSFGIKFLSKPDHYFRKMRYAHVLKGFFIKPELILGSYKVIPFEDYYFYRQPNSSTDKVSVTVGAFLINIGKQWVFDDAFALELYGGVGYGLKSRDDVPQFSVLVGSDPPLAGRVGLRVGFLY